VWKEKSNLKAQGYLLTRKVVERSERSDETTLVATQPEDNLASGLIQDVHSLQEKILSRVKQLPAARVYVDKFQSGKILTNDELQKVIELYAKEETRRELEFFSIDLVGYPPEGWLTINCKICNSPLPGVLVSPSFANGKFIQDYCKGWTHYECRT
jgi:hypothetical protein